LCREAVKWYHKAAGQEHAESQYFLGLGYFFGEGVSKNEAEAAKWFQKAAQKGHADAQKILKKLGH
jgi:TPR repeat protein